MDCQPIGDLMRAVESLKKSMTYLAVIGVSAIDFPRIGTPLTTGIGCYRRHSVPPFLA